MSGDRIPRVRLQDVAHHAGVSTRTVSNVVNNYHYVSDDMRLRVQASLDQLGYSVNRVARGLRSGRTGMIALVVPQLAEPYFAQLAQVVIRVAVTRGLVVLIETTEDPELEKAIMRGSLGTVVDGVLINSVAATVADQPLVPLVFLGEGRATRAVDHVGIDNVEAARIVVRHLLQQGCRRIAALGVTDTATSDLRLQGYQDELHSWQVHAPPALHLLTSNWSPEGGYAATSQLLDRESSNDVDAVFAFNDSLAYGAIRALSDHQIAVPDQVAVAGIDDLPTNAYLHPQLTSIAPNMQVIAEQAVDKLMRQVEGTNTGPERLTVPFELKVRESSNRSRPAAPEQRKQGKAQDA